LHISVRFRRCFLKKQPGANRQGVIEWKQGKN
jgi:hypothetical protein